MKKKIAILTAAMCTVTMILGGCKAEDEEHNWGNGSW